MRADKKGQLQAAILLSLKQQTTNPPIEKWSEGKLLKKGIAKQTIRNIA